jgi:hypothetical protein
MKREGIRANMSRIKESAHDVARKIKVGGLEDAAGPQPEDEGVAGPSPKSCVTLH